LAIPGSMRALEVGGDHLRKFGAEFGDPRLDAEELGNRHRHRIDVAARDFDAKLGSRHR
jgi:hypothetical protein